jgi:hypothetical protein
LTIVTTVIVTTRNDAVRGVNLVEKRVRTSMGDVRRTHAILEATNYGQKFKVKTEIVVGTVDPGGDHQLIVFAA